MLASGSITSAASTRLGFELRASDAEIGVDHGDVLAEVDALGGGVDLDHLVLRAAHVDGELLALEVGQRLDRRILGEDHQVAEREARADDAQRHAFVIKLLEYGRPADQRVGLAGGEARVERGDRRIGVNVELEAVFGVEAARLHDVPHQRIEHRQREAGDLDDRLVLRRAACGAAKLAMAKATTANAARPRRDILSMQLPLLDFTIVVMAPRSLWLNPGSATLLRFQSRANNRRV